MDVTPADGGPHKLPESPGAACR